MPWPIRQRTRLIAGGSSLSRQRYAKLNARENELAASRPALSSDLIIN